jgi:transposase-like protein
VFDFPPHHQRKLRTTNGVERLNHEIRRRTAVVGIFPHEESCLRLASAVLMEIDDDWQVGRVYLNFQEQGETPQPRFSSLPIPEGCQKNYRNILALSTRAIRK